MLIKEENVKKFALGILSVFMILGGVLLSACEQKVSLSVSAEEVVIYTNYDKEGDYQSKNIDVTLENSSAGINVEILKGGDSIRISDVKKKTDSKYSFTIYGDRSGEAEVKVSALDDVRQSKTIDVTVNTMLEYLEKLPDDSVDARTNKFVVRGEQKTLNVEDYFNVSPVTANVKDIEWSLADTNVSGAEIVDGNKLVVSDSYDLKTITLKATFTRNVEINSTVEFEVLDGASINSYTLNGINIYRDNTLVTSDDISFELVRNNENLSSIEGAITFNTEYDINLSIDVYEKTQSGQFLQLKQPEYEQYFIFDILGSTVNTATGKVTYNFEIDALDGDNIDKTANLYFVLKAGYTDYNYDITTYDVSTNSGAIVLIKDLYTVERVELLNSDNDVINGSTVDIFSSYSTGNGYKMTLLLSPSEVAVDNDLVYIRINKSQFDGLNLDSSAPVDGLVKFYYKGEVLQFVVDTNDAEYYVSTTAIRNGDNFYVSSVDGFDSPITFEFKPASTYSSASTTLTMNLYKIASGEKLTVTKLDGDQVDDVTYVSSSTSSARSVIFEMIVEGVTTKSGLSIKTDENAKFTFSELTLLEKTAVDDENSIKIRFTVTLNGSNFADSTTFWLEHITGKKSDEFEVSAFIPLNSVSITNADKSSSNVFVDNTSTQNFVVENAEIKTSTIQNSSVSKLMVEAGTILPITVNYKDATLSNNGFSYMVLSYDKLFKTLTDAGSDDDAATAQIKQMIDAGEGIEQYYQYFTSDEPDFVNRFSLTEEKLTLTDNAFKGFVCVLLSGFDENHNSVTVARFFYLESFYSVKYLASNVTSQTLYTTETLSISDIGRSYIDVTISMRADEKVPTYSNDIDCFEFVSVYGFDVNASKDLWKNDYYQISDVGFAGSGKYFTFRITANSTQMQTSIRDILTISYVDPNGFSRETEIQIQIKNEKRIESVQWLNRTENDEIYLNLTTTISSERNFSISTAVYPGEANDLSLYYQYFATEGAAGDLAVKTSSTGQTFNLSISTTKGSYGNLFLLPSDMVKIKDGVRHIIVYKYTTGDNGEIIETPIYKKMSEFNLYYEDLLTGTDEFSNYFYNNDGEKIYYEDIIVKIAITIADGLSEGTAIRIYNESDLLGISDSAKYYKIMNNLSLSGWKSFSTFGGMIFGKDDTVTLQLDGESFVDTLTGTIKNLTFTGNVDTANAVEGGGFVANVNNGTISNVCIDVYYGTDTYTGTTGSSVSYKRYMSSTLTSNAASVGGIAGVNNGTISDSYVYGLTIVSNYSGGQGYIGGIAGQNAKTITNCGVEFYNFSKKTTETVSDTIKNTFTGNAAMGGIVGLAGEKSVIEKSYSYAYSLTGEQISNHSISDIFKNSSYSKGAFVGQINDGATVKESFAYMGNLNTPFVSGVSTTKANFENSYMTYYNNTTLTTRIFKSASFSYANGTYNGSGIENAYLLTLADIGDIKWNNLTANLSSEIWELENISSDVNFGFMYLKNIQQSAEVDLNDVTFADNTTPLKSLSAGNDKGILFVYNTTVSPSTSAEQSALTNYNTISLADLFGVSAKQARSLLVASNSKNISISTTSIRVLSENLTAFEITVHSKMDFTNSKTFEVVVLNYLPTLTTTVSQLEIKDGRTILLQTGTDNSKVVMYNLSNTIYLNGTGYLTAKDKYTIKYNLENSDPTDTTDYVSVSANSNSLNLSGNASHNDEDYTLLNSWIEIEGLVDEYNNTIKENASRKFKVSVYNGATALVIENATSLTVKPSQYAVFDVTMTTDAKDDTLVFGLNYDGIEIDGQSVDDSTLQFVVDSKLKLDVSWTKMSDSNNVYSYRVWVKVNDETKHLVEKNYNNLTLTINAQSQSSNDKCKKTLNLAVLTQEIDDVSLSTYNIENRKFVRTVLYYDIANEITNTITPSSDAIIAVTINPAYAKMSNFTLTYSTGGTSVGTISLSRLKYNSRYGYYVDTSSTSLVTNGIRVNLTEEDKTGNGVFYFRMYVSSAFTNNSSLTFTLSCYDSDTVLTTATHTLAIDYMQEAQVKVGGASTYVLAKGDSVTVTVTTNLDQELSGSGMYLKNNYANISLSETTCTIYDSYKVYTATLTAYVDAKLQGNAETGIFYVGATVERTINNTLETKESLATVCLVDFSVDGSGISVGSNVGKTTYNGKEYDTFQSYVDATYSLSFDYPMLPETYIYDKNNSEEVEAVKKIEKSRTEFETNNYYRDDQVGYYINYQYNRNLGTYEQIELKNQLWYATDENNATSITNDSGIVQKGVFRIDETSTGLSITGLRTGRQLMKLRTTIIYQGVEFEYDYYFLIVVELWTDEESPTQIFTADEFVSITESEKAGNYILMNDIVLPDYTPIDTDKITSFDGNGYTIHINSFAMPDDSTLNLALFGTVDEDTTLKNMRVNIYNGGQIVVNVDQYKTINIAGFAVENNGVIYNCEVVSYYDEDYQSSKLSGDTGLVVKYTIGSNTDPVNLTAKQIASLNLESKVAGFVVENTASIMNSRVGGDSYKHIVDIAGTNYLKTQTLGNFVIEGQGEVMGFANTNSGYISASFAKNVQIYNDTNATTSITAGFVGYNSSKIQNSYVTGKGSGYDSSVDGTQMSDFYNTETNITAMGYVAGFVYDNEATIKNSYANIAIECDQTVGYLVAGFVYINGAEGDINLCFTACKISSTDISQMAFSGVDAAANSLNAGNITFSYYFSLNEANSTTQTSLTSGVLPVSDVTKEDSFYGFSFASDDEAYNGVWAISDAGISLVSANKIAFSNRYAVSSASGQTSIFYTKTMLDADTMRSVDISYGSENNPIIIRDAYDFAMATGKASSTKEISAYKEHYTSTSVDGSYRLVKDVDMSEIDQNAENANSIQLTTTQKTFTGLLDGNGFTISNINLGSSLVTENYGLFARLDRAVVMNLDLVVDSIHNSQANIVGTLAGTAVDSRILAISLSPVDSQTSQLEKTSILGNNVVGGVVGMLFGDSSLSDVQVKDIDIYSSYFVKGKSVDSNANNTGAVLRNNIENGSSLVSYVSQISYAGGIAGYVDIYSSISSDYVRFSNALEVSDYDIITVGVSDAVNIYGEVSGGLFGYVGNATYIYDATITLDADMSLSNPSYIISKNLFAGGLIGENYGGLFAVSASYSDELQKTIEDNENSYYNGSMGVEKGQQSIFSYTSADEGFKTNTNDPLYVGGLVGYMGGGYIYIGYNKLNVISHSASTLAAGGVIGLAGYTTNTFDVEYVKNNPPKVNILLNDVYASGDVLVDGTKNEKVVGVSAGIVGALQQTNGNTSVLAMKNVVGANYYTYNGASLVGDNAEMGEAGYTAENHFTLVGKIYKNEKDNDNYKTDDKLSASLYLIDSDDEYNDMLSTKGSATVGQLTVGGYRTVEVGSTTLKINPFGFRTNNDTDIGGLILDVEAIGDASMSTTSAAYAKMYKYFLSNGWSDQYWEHEQARLFPDIQLIAKENIIFWDCDNTEEVLKAMENSGITVVVRGLKTDAQGGVAGYGDIEVKVDGKTPDAVSGFRGTLISYYDYYSSTLEGIVTHETTNGGKVGDKVGLILSGSLFKSIQSDVLVQGINFYFDGDPFTLVEDELQTTIFRDISITLNKSWTLEAQFIQETVTESYYTTGLFANTAEASSFVNVDVKLRKDVTLTLSHQNNATASDKVYFGLLAGQIKQTSSAKQVAVQGITVTTLDDKGAKTSGSVAIGIKVSAASEVYAGLYAGRISKTEKGSRKISVGLANAGQVNLNLTFVAGSSATDGSNASVYIGGFVGQVEGVDNVTMSGDSEESSTKTNLSINISSTVGTLYAGLGFGDLKNSSATIASESDTAKIVGGIYENNGATCEDAYIGGIAGMANGAVAVQGYGIEFSVGSYNADAYFTGSDDSKVSIFEQNLYDYSEKLSPFVATGTANVGGLFGAVQGTLNISNNFDISGTMDIKTSETANVGGLVGWLNSATFNATSAVCENSINIAVTEVTKDENKTAIANENATANIGGIIGYVTGNSIISILASATSGNMAYDGNVLASINEINFGGAIGNWNYSVTGNDSQDSSINRAVFGGSLRIFETKTAENTYKIATNVNAGGIVGNMSTKANNTFEITNSLSYGDIFVIYQPKQKEKLTTYNVGGIVGVAPTTEKVLTISNSISLLTSFNDRRAYGYGDDKNQKDGDFVNAIVGANSGAVTYSENFYASGVTLAYQEEDGNADLAYNSEANNQYIGYSNVVKNENGGKLTAETGILSKVKQIYAIPDDVKEGHKLKPYSYSSSDTSKLINGTNEDSSKNLTFEGNSHGIAWISLSEDLTDVTNLGTNSTDSKSISGVIADNLTNVAFVGNGHIITRNDDAKEATANDGSPFGGLVNSMGSEYSKDNKDNTPNFNIISGLVLDMNVKTTDYNKKDTFDGDTEGVIASYGGVAGKVDGTSFIYGVGVKGEISVGGKTTAFDLGGLVGTLNSGVIDQCYVDADITYRGFESESGVLAGAVGLVENQFFNMIRATYTSGQLETYVDVPIYTFAKRNEDSDSGFASWLVDCYSIAQTKYSGEADQTQAISFANLTETKNNQTTYGFSTFGIVIDGNDSENTIGTLSLAYNEFDKSCSKVTDSANVPTKFGSAVTTWYFNPYVNYGYASHGFGYLKNVTTYTRTTSNTTSSTETTETAGYSVPDYEYTPLSYEKVAKGEYDDNWYLGVLNQGKFDQMLGIVSSTDENIYNNNYKFVLRYDFKVTNLGQNIGLTGKNFVLEGNNTTLDLTSTESTKGLFGDVVGTIENLKIINANIGASGSVGVLATSVTGNLNNIQVAGTINESGSGKDVFVGGAVGTLKGDAKNITSTVYILNKGNNTVGGIVGKLESGSVEYSSNAGIIRSEGSDKTEVLSSITVKNNTTSTASDASVDISSISGGIVGQANSDTSITNSYNANSVLDGYSNKASASRIAGGIVGYSNGATIDSCYNTGLVGAGNYSSEQRAFAGGIFGFANGGTVSNCLNDAAVQSISKSPTSTDYKIEVTKNGGNYYTDYTLTPHDLKFDVKITYNVKNTARLVYAYGIGYTESSDTISDCDSSTDNIKNDGIIGKYSSTTTLTFERQNILDNNGGKLKHWGSFTVDGYTVESDEFTPNVYISGYDSYGFPARVYMKDKISRIYAGTTPTTLGFTNDIRSAEQSRISQLWPGYREYNGAYIYSESEGKYTIKEKDETTGAIIFDETTKVQKKWNEFTEYEYVGQDDRYLMSATTTYYSSASFVDTESDKGLGYDGVLDGNGSISLVYDGKMNETNTSSKYTDIDSKITAIDEQRSNTKNLEAITINGEHAAIVYNADNFKTVYMPYKISIEAIINDTYGVIDPSSLSKNGVDIDVVAKTTPKDGTTNSTSIKPQYTDITSLKPKYEVATKDNTITINADLYFSEVCSGTFKVTLSYTSKVFETTLGKDNVVQSGDNIEIHLKDEKIELDLSTYEDGGSDHKEYNFTVKVGDDILDSSELDIDQEHNTIIYTGDKSLDYFNEKTLSISYTYTYDAQESTTHNLNVTSGTADGTLSPEAGQIATFKSYNENTTTFTKATLVDGSDGAYYYCNINSEVGNYSSFAIKFNYNGDGYLVSYVKGIFGSNSSKRDSSPYVELVQNENLFIIHFYNFDNIDELQTAFQNATLYTQKTDITSEGTLETSKTSKGTLSSFTYTYTQTLQGDGNFTIENGKGKYTGTDFNGWTEEVNCGGFVGYSTSHTYNYTLDSMTLTNSGSNDLGYELTFYDNDNNIKNWSMGAFTSNSTSKIIGNIAGSTRFKVNYYTTTKSADGRDASKDTYNEPSLSFRVDDNKQYSISNGTATCPIHNEEEDCVVTRKTITKTYVKYTYIYTIYGCGAIDVQYIYQENDTDKDYKPNDQYATKYSKRYITTPECVSNGQMYKLKLTGLNDDDGYIWEEISDSSKTTFEYNNFEKNSDAKDAQGLLWSEITVDVVASYFGTNEVLFSKFDIIDATPTVDATGIVKQTSPTFNPGSVTLYSGLEDSYQIKDILGDVSDVQYRVDNGDWNSNGTNKTITYSGDYGKHTYKYKWTAVVDKINSYSWRVEGSDNSTSGNTFNTGEETTTDFKYVILEGDIGWDKTLSNNNKTIIGHNYTITFIQETDKSFALIDTNEATIKDLNVVGIANLRNASTDVKSLLINTNSASVQNVNIFGNVRNISSTSSSQNISSTIDTNTSSASVLSYVTMTGLKNASMATLTSTLTYKDNQEKVNYTSYDVLIAGDGANGTNGADGTQTESGRDGKSGKSGTSGGSISVSTSGFNGVARAGIGGHAGYGGNGANGKFEENKVFGGGAGGTAGSNGDAGTTTGTNEDTVIGTRTIITDQIAGNGGIGGFGRVDGTIYYTSSAGGDANGGSHGKNGTEEIWKSDGDYRFGYGKELLSSAHYYPTGFLEADDNNNWYKNIQNAINKSTQDVGSLDGSDNSEKGKGLKTTTVYISVQVHFSWYAFQHQEINTSNGGEWKIVVWTSGECLNGAGVCGYASEEPAKT